jgi:hypothetical protein
MRLLAPSRHNSLRGFLLRNPGAVRNPPNDRTNDLTGGRVVAEKSGDRWHVFEVWLCTVAFPVGNAGLVDAELLPNLPQQELQQEPSATGWSGWLNR